MFTSVGTCWQRVDLASRISFFASQLLPQKAITVTHLGDAQGRTEELSVTDAWQEGKKTRHQHTTSTILVCMLAISLVPVLVSMLFDAVSLPAATMGKSC